MVRVAERVEPALLAVIVALTISFTPAAVSWKVTVVCPPGTVTVAGKMTELLELERFTTFPLGPAGPVRVTVAVDEPPLCTELGLSVSV